MSPASISYVVVTPEHAALFENMARDVFDGPPQAHRLKRYLQDPNHVMVLAVSDGLVVGQVMAAVHLHPCKPNEMYVDELGVSPEFRRQGIARRLVLAVIAEGRKHACREIWLATETDNTAAQALYSGMGMHQQLGVLFDRLV